MDLTGSLADPAGDFLAANGSDMTGQAFYADWRERQRIEQYQDSLLMLGHSGYLETCRRAFVYCLKKHNVNYTADGVREFMQVYMDLRPYANAMEGLKSLGSRYKLVALSNGEQWYLENLLVSNVPVEFDAIISVDQVGVFKPAPGIYRKAVQRLGCEPGEIMMVAAHAFDILGRPSLWLQGGRCQPLQTAHRGLGVPARHYRRRLCRVGRAPVAVMKGIGQWAGLE